MARLGEFETYVPGVGDSFPGVGNSLVLQKECKKCSQCGYTSDEFFKVCPACGKKCGSQ